MGAMHGCGVGTPDSVAANGGGGAHHPVIRLFLGASGQGLCNDVNLRFHHFIGDVKGIKTDINLVQGRQS